MRLSVLKYSVLLIIMMGEVGCKKEEPAPPSPSLPTPQPPPKPMGEDVAAYFGELGKEKVVPKKNFLKAKPTPQSVLVVVIDTLTARHLSSYGYKRKTSPNIDRLAKEGILFNNYVSNSSWTRPSYATILTGLPKSGHNVELGGGGLALNIKTVAERFKDAGYRTASFVGNPLMRQIWGFGQGFELYQDTETYDKAFPFDGILTKDAIEWLESIGEAKHYTTLFLTAPHAPYRPPRKRRYFLKAVPKGHILEYPFREYRQPLPKPQHQRIVAAYDDEIAYSDYQVGRLLDYLEKKGRAKDTTVVVTADHGEILGEHNCYGHAYHMWEGTLRVPLVIRSTNIDSTNRLDDSPHTHIDLAPSLLQIAGLPVPADLPGRSLLRAYDQESERVRLSQYNAHGIRRQAIRDNQYKIIHYHKINEAVLSKLNSLKTQLPHADPRDLPSLVASLKGERYELYDLIADPEETTDVFESMKNKPPIQSLLETLLTHLNEKELPVGQMSEELIEALKNAGYFVSDEE